MSDTAGMNLKQPEQINWDNYNPGSSYRRPPVPLTVNDDGKMIRTTFYGQLPTPVKEEGREGTFDEGYRVFLLDPITLVQGKNPSDAAGYVLRFYRASVRGWRKRNSDELSNANAAGNVIKAAGIRSKPQTNAEYEQAMATVGGKVVPLTIDWFAKCQETGERVTGYLNFPDDPKRPGQKKAILEAGDVYKDRDGNEHTFKGEVAFANAEVKYVLDPARK